MSLTQHFQDAKARASRQFLDDFDHYTTGFYYNASSQKEAVDYLLEAAAPVAVAAAIAADVLPLHPYPTNELHADAGIDGHAREISMVADELEVFLSRHQITKPSDEAMMLFRFLAAHLLKARAELVMQDQRKNYFYSRGDETALTAKDTPTIFRQFGEFLDHTARRKELEQAGLTICDVIAPDEETESDESEKPWSGTFYYGMGEPTPHPTYAGHWSCEFGHWLTTKGFCPDDFPGLEQVTRENLADWEARKASAPAEVAKVTLIVFDPDAVHFACDNPRDFLKCGATHRHFLGFLSHPVREEAWAGWIAAEQLKKEAKQGIELGASGALWRALVQWDEATPENDAPDLDDGISDLAD